MFEWIGWIATALFAISYFFHKPAALRRVQALAAVLWIGYGIVIKAPPVIVANVVVAAIAIISSVQRRDQSDHIEAEAKSG
ncbi:MAG: YgjV family protein [Blastocatellales bacterium]